MTLTANSGRLLACGPVTVCTEPISNASQSRDMLSKGDTYTYLLRVIQEMLAKAKASCMF